MYSSMSSVAPLKVLVCLGSVRDGRMCARVASFVVEKLKDASMSIEILDPEKLKLPLLKQPLHFYRDQSQAPKELHALNEIVKGADALVLVAAEYNRQMPPALTNLLDHLPPRSYAFKSSAIVSYSLGQGGMSSAAQARTLLVELGAPPIPYILQVTEVAKKLDADGHVSPGAEYLHEQSKKMVAQLSWYANALRDYKKLHGELEWSSPTMSV